MNNVTNGTGDFTTALIWSLEALLQGYEVSYLETDSIMTLRTLYEAESLGDMAHRTLADDVLAKQVKQRLDSMVHTADKLFAQDSTMQLVSYDAPSNGFSERRYYVQTYDEEVASLDWDYRDDEWEDWDDE